MEDTKIFSKMQQRLGQPLTMNYSEGSKCFQQESTMSVDKPLFLRFDNVTYSVRIGILRRGTKHILRNISGDFRPGELTTILGLSGAGKSTLMNILAGFTSSSSVAGSITVNNKPRDLAKFRRIAAYIMQDDNLEPLLTVQEAMNVAAELKLTLSPKQKVQRISEILVAMGLDGARRTRTDQLSGGQRKRLAIALELINNPPIMFFDEPTSGLDSVSSTQCMRVLKQLAREGRTIICTIHQPSAMLFNMIDHLYVVANGSCVYTGGTRNLVPYLSSAGLHCPTHYSPVDFLMEVCNGDYGKHVPKLIDAIENGKTNMWRSTITLNFSNPEELMGSNMTASLKMLHQLQSPIRLYSIETEYKHTPYYATGFWKQLCVLLKRNAIKLSRDRVLTFTRLIMHFAVALLVGTIYFRIGQDASYVLNNFNLLFFNIMFLMFSAFSATITTFPSEIPIVMREHFNRWYKLRSYYLANKLADFPVQFTAIAMYILIVYYMSDQLPELRRFCLYILVCVAITLVAQAVGLILGTGLTVQYGMILGPLLILPSMIFSGFFVHLNDAHPYLHWLFHLSFLKYGFEGVIVAIYGYDRPKLKCSEVYCHFAVPENLLQAVDMKHSDYWFSLLVLSGLYVGLELTAYILLRIKLKTRI